MNRRQIAPLATTPSLLLPWKGAAPGPRQAPSDRAHSLSRPDSGIWRSYTNGNTVRAMAAAGDSVWAGTEGGVVRWSRTTGTHVKYTAPDGLASDNVLAIAIHEAGHIWFGTYGGVSRLDGSAWTIYTPADGLVAETVSGIVVDEADHKWFGTGGGVGEFFDSYRTRLPLVAKNAH